MAEQLELFSLGQTAGTPMPALEFRADQPPLKRLEDKAFHDALLKYFQARIMASEHRMQQFYPRWRVNELKFQGFITLPDYERILAAMNKAGEPPSPVSITFPYAYANAWTVVTYMLHTFCGRKPMFQISANKAEHVKSAQNLEKLVQWNADRTRLIRSIFQMLMDGQIYGVGATRTLWKKKVAKRTEIYRPEGFMGLIQSALGSGSIQRRKVDRVVFEGNEVESIDPFMFFPDPNVPMSEVSRKGEYVFWRTFVGKHDLLAAQAQGSIAHVEKVRPMQPNSGAWGNTNPDSSRGRAISGDSIAALGNNMSSIPYYQFDQGSVIIIPKELGLGESNVPERWLVGIVNKSQIVQLEPLDVDFDMHPVSVIEPNTAGYGFGQPSLVDYVSPIQDTLSWLLNSHIHNVRAALNNQFVVDPSMVEMQDLQDPKPGKLIRLKRAAMGQDVRAAITQLPVADVTRGHMNDLQLFQRVADTITGIGDNVRGLQDAGGRKTATEVRTSIEAGTSRLAAQSRLVSSQGIVDLAEQLASNLQSKLSESVYISVLGQAGLDAPVTIGPNDVQGDFTYPVHDGTLPLDRVALLDVWKEILMGVAQDQELRTQFSVPSIFEHIAKLGGAENIESFKVQVAPEPPPGAVPLGALR